MFAIHSRSIFFLCDLIFCLQPNPSSAETPQQSSVNEQKMDPVTVSLWFAVIVTIFLCILFGPAAICGVIGIVLAIVVNPPRIHSYMYIVHVNGQIFNTRSYIALLYIAATLSFIITGSHFSNYCIIIIKQGLILAISYYIDLRRYNTACCTPRSGALATPLYARTHAHTRGVT